MAFLMLLFLFRTLEVTLFLSGAGSGFLSFGLLSEKLLESVTETSVNHYITVRLLLQAVKFKTGLRSMQPSISLQASCQKLTWGGAEGVGRGGKCVQVDEMLMDFKITCHRISQSSGGTCFQNSRLALACRSSYVDGHGLRLSTLCTDWCIHAESMQPTISMLVLPLSSSDSSSIGSSLRAHTGSSNRTAHEGKGHWILKNYVLKVERVQTWWQHCFIIIFKGL